MVGETDWSLIDTLREKTGTTGNVSQIYMKVVPGADVSATVEALKKTPGLEDWPIYSIEELASLLSIGNVPGLQAFIIVIMGIGAVLFAHSASRPYRRVWQCL